MTKRQTKNTIDVQGAAMSSIDQFPPELANTCKRWALRALIDLGGCDSIVQHNYCSEPGLMRALGIPTDLIDDYDQDGMRRALKELHGAAVKAHDSKDEHTTLENGDCVLHRNITWLADQVSLTPDEQQILLFSVLIRQNQFLGDAIESVGRISTPRAMSVLSVVLGISVSRVRRALAEESSLLQSGLMSIDNHSNFDFCNKIELLTGLAEQLRAEQENLYFLFSSNFVVAPKAKLTVEHFSHLGQKITNLSTFLAVAVAERQKGVNILVYGTPGTGKTELGRSLAEKLNLDLFEVSVEDTHGHQIAGENRLASYRLSQRILSKRTNAMLVFDEIEDIAVKVDHDFFAPKANRSGNKGFLNQLLQENCVPTIWVTNSLEPLDAAQLRRFDYCLALDIPPKNVRIAMLVESTNGLNVSGDWCKAAAANDALSPALMSRATKVAITMHKGGANLSIELLLDDVIDSAMKVQSREVPRTGAKAGTVKYQLSAVNADCNLDEVLEGLKQTGEGRVCLYGPPGTGKSAFAKHVAEVIGKTVLLKRASDILAPYIGQTESNMAAMFRQAKKDGAILILDEADSFLRSRDGAKRSWEITAVNEMLTQMESFEGIFFATTNLMDHLDSACLRRFDMKINFGYLKQPQRLSLFREVCQSLDLDWSPAIEANLNFLEKLTPGDFENVLRQSRLRQIRTAEDLIARLKQEMKLKNLGSTHSIGFLATGTD